MYTLMQSKKGTKFFMKEKIKEMLNLYNIAVAICIIVIIVSVYIILKPEDGKIFAKKEKAVVDGVEVVQSNKKETEEISENEARKLAVKQFKKLNEKVKEDSLDIMKIQRKGEEYYYIVSSKNNMEIKVMGGKITRINSSLVEESH